MKKLILALFLVEVFALNASGKQERAIPVEEIVITLGSMTLTTGSTDATVSGEFTVNSEPGQIARRRIIRAKRTILQSTGKK